ncbi:DinB family protein [Sporosarcina cyprini]|uniref:DinB family protein n=1 Tax=Sporosarcina cyprini TaxID=2910523 RepID=UPI001EE09158|nr:DinB family protein [Sporosarcina cyprini]MCG3086822.1 DinB family protein [Sporosarcina cyprini]
MVFEGNSKIRRKIYQALEGLTDEEFNGKPSGGGWSPKQILEHLTLMETYIATKILREMKNPDSLRASKKLILLASDRVVNVNLPEQTHPTDHYKTIADLKEELHNSRIYLLDVYDASCKDALRDKSFAHPNYGHLPLIQWFPFIGLYEKCHLKRLRKTIDELKMENRPFEPVGGRND